MMATSLLSVRLLLITLVASHYHYSWALSSSTSLVRYRARVAYNGSGFQGFQLQQQSPNDDDSSSSSNNKQRNSQKRTVQGCLEQALQQRFHVPHVRVVAAGRTDAGVHARGQAVHFDLPKSNVKAAVSSSSSSSTAAADDDKNDSQQQQQQQLLSAVEVSLNKLLPPDIRIWNVQKAPPLIRKAIKTSDDGGNNKNLVTIKEYAFDVMYDSTHKLYSYRLSLAPVMDPLERYHRWHPDALKGKPVDPVQLQRLLQYFVGEHDFRAFAGAVERLETLRGGSVNTVRQVYRVDLVEEGNNGNYRIDMLIKGALYKQVRNMVGTVLDVCRGVMDEETFVNLINQENSAVPFTRNHNPSKPAPPEGLTLEYVYFDNDEYGF